MNKAIQDVIAERQRQQSVEGWTTEHDDELRAEIARRDAVASEVVGWQFQSDGGKWLDIHDPEDALRYGYKVRELYTAAPPAVLPQPDPDLAEFYEAASYPDLVRELVKHIEQLQDSAKRNVKPWEDTFPPTLLPSYIDRIKRADDLALGAQPQKVVELPGSFKQSKGDNKQFMFREDVIYALDAANVKWEVNK